MAAIKASKIIPFASKTNYGYSATTISQLESEGLNYGRTEAEAQYKKDLEKRFECQGLIYEDVSEYEDRILVGTSRNQYLYDINQYFKAYYSGDGEFSSLITKKPCSILLVGEKGSGKTTFIKSFFAKSVKKATRKSVKKGKEFEIEDKLNQPVNLDIFSIKWKEFRTTDGKWNYDQLTKFFSCVETLKTAVNKATTVMIPKNTPDTNYIFLTDDLDKYLDKDDKDANILFLRFVNEFRKRYDDQFKCVSNHFTLILSIRPENEPKIYDREKIEQIFTISSPDEQSLTEYYFESARARVKKQLTTKIGNATTPTLVGLDLRLTEENLKNGNLDKIVDYLFYEMGSISSYNEVLDWVKNQKQQKKTNKLNFIDIDQYLTRKSINETLDTINNNVFYLVNYVENEPKIDFSIPTTLFDQSNTNIVLQTGQREILTKMTAYKLTKDYKPFQTPDVSINYKDDIIEFTLKNEYENSELRKLKKKFKSNEALKSIYFSSKIDNTGLSKEGKELLNQINDIDYSKASNWFLSFGFAEQKIGTLLAGEKWFEKPDVNEKAKNYIKDPASYILEKYQFEDEVLYKIVSDYNEPEIALRYFVFKIKIIIQLLQTASCILFDFDKIKLFGQVSFQFIDKKVLAFVKDKTDAVVKLYTEAEEKISDAITSYVQKRDEKKSFFTIFTEKVSEVFFENEVKKANFNKVKQQTKTEIAENIRKYQSELDSIFEFLLNLSVDFIKNQGVIQPEQLIFANNSLVALEVKKSYLQYFYIDFDDSAILTRYYLTNFLLSDEYSRDSVLKIIQNKLQPDISDKNLETYLYSLDNYNFKYTVASGVFREYDDKIDTATGTLWPAWETKYNEEKLKFDKLELLSPSTKEILSDLKSKFSLKLNTTYNQHFLITSIEKQGSGARTDNYFTVIKSEDYEAWLKIFMNMSQEDFKKYDPILGGRDDETKIRRLFSKFKKYDLFNNILKQSYQSAIYPLISELTIKIDDGSGKEDFIFRKMKLDKEKNIADEKDTRIQQYEKLKKGVIQVNYQLDL